MHVSVDPWRVRTNLHGGAETQESSFSCLPSLDHENISGDAEPAQLRYSEGEGQKAIINVLSDLTLEFSFPGVDLFPYARIAQVVRDRENGVQSN